VLLVPIANYRSQREQTRERMLRFDRLSERPQRGAIAMNKRCLTRMGSLLLSLLILQGCGGPQQLETSMLGDFARFGRDVDISVGRAVVGAADENSSTGAVYVFTRNTNAWSIEARIESPSPADEAFGDAVAISQDTIAVGAPRDHKPGALRAGSVYIFERDATGWSHTATLGASVPQP
jgi:hypothetical protein